MLCVTMCVKPPVNCHVQKWHDSKAMWSYILIFKKYICRAHKSKGAGAFITPRGFYYFFLRILTHIPYWIRPRPPRRFPRVGFSGDGFSSILQLDAGKFGKVHAQYSLKVPVRIEIFDSRISTITHVMTWHAPCSPSRTAVQRAALRTCRL